MEEGAKRLGNRNDTIRGLGWLALKRAHYWRRTPVKKESKGANESFKA